MLLSEGGVSSWRLTDTEQKLVFNWAPDGRFGIIRMTVPIHRIPLRAIDPAKITTLGSLKRPLADTKATRLLFLLVHLNCAGIVLLHTLNCWALFLIPLSWPQQWRALVSVSDVSLPNLILIESYYNASSASFCLTF